MQSDAAEQKAADVNLAVSVAAEQGREVVYRYKAAQRIRDVGIDARTAVEQRAPEGAVHEQIAQVDLPQGWIARQEEIQADQQPARPRDSLDFRHGFFQ